jgi:peptidoglycan/xylan/chitin deacetylase (PgdA/CDA1 family)
MEFLARYRNVMSLCELTRRHEMGRLPRDAAAVTFDDGYASNLLFAKPILERLGLPATVFVVSGFLDDPREPWSDELVSLIMGSTTLPEELVLKLPGRSECWRGTGWLPRGRKVVHREIHDILLGASAEDRRAAVDRLNEQIGRLPLVTTSRRILTSQELVELAEGGLVEIGAHTETHPWLPRLDEAAQRREIRASKLTLEGLLGRPIRGFAYPYGEHDAKTVSALSDLRFSYACTTAKGYVHHRDSSLRLPRFCASNWNIEEFSRRFTAAKAPVWMLSPWVRTQPFSARNG